jgi:hypothetical protein
MEQKHPSSSLHYYSQCLPNHFVEKIETQQIIALLSQALSLMPAALQAAEY